MGYFKPFDVYILILKTLALIFGPQIKIMLRLFCKQRFFILALFNFLFITVWAQVPQYNNSAVIYQQMKKLNVLGSVLYVAAHPDDENTRLLAYLANEKLYRTAYLSLTRGDGGQNLIGDEQGIELGLIRTQELLAARRIDGAEQFFSSAYDFGFCKTSDEAIKTWNHDKVLSDIVWLIRKYQPDIIITRFPGDERAGHGHHQASNILAVEAFSAAADQTKFPEQFQYGVSTWQAKRILWNTFNFGTTNTTNQQQFKIDVGLFNPLLGKGYGEIASESRSQHKSQGFGVPRQRGSQLEYFTHLAGDSLTNDLMNGISTSWSRMNAAPIEFAINNLIAHYDFQHPENSLNELTEIYQQIEKQPLSYWQQKKLDEVKDLIMQCSGLLAEATTTNEYAVPGTNFETKFLITLRNKANVVLHHIQMRSFDSTFNLTLSQNTNVNISRSFIVPFDERISQPYWLEEPLEKGHFNIKNQLQIGLPQNKAAYSVNFQFEINGINLSIEKPVYYKYTDDVKGELYQPLRVAAPIAATLDNDVFVFNGTQEKLVHFNLKAKKKYPSFTVSTQTNTGWKIIGNTSIDSMNAIKPLEKQFVVSAPSVNDKSTLQLNINEKPLQTERSIKYDHIPNILYYKPAKATIEKFDLKTTGKHIGYITGAGDKVPQALQQMGFTVTLLSEKDITVEQLKQFDAVLAGIRAYNIHDWIDGKYDILMDYIKQGGTYIVQYNTSNFISSVTNKIGPYPFTISRTRVTDEQAAVEIILPNHPAFQWPNKISTSDFEGWVQERSVYQAEKIDSNYAAPISMHDANESASNGSLIIAPYGKGNFVYTGLVFFRELPAGVTGAYRLMANLIALSTNKK